MENVQSSIPSSGTSISFAGTYADANIDRINVNTQQAILFGNGLFSVPDLNLNAGGNSVTVNALDKAGNTTQQIINLTLNTQAKALYDYDADGNLKSRCERGDTWLYSWDEDNRLIKAVSSTGKEIMYGYYDDGMLAARTEGATQTTYIYDGIHCVAKYDSLGGQTEYIYGPGIDEVLCRIDGAGGVRYYHQDALNSVVAITDGFRNEVATYSYDVYGKIRQQTGSLANEIMYTGRWLDATTGIYYYRARWYDAVVGLFVAKDPVLFYIAKGWDKFPKGIETGKGTKSGFEFWESYSYAANNPSNRADPYGLAPFDWYDITSWNFTNHCGASKSGSGNYSSCFDGCCEAHDDCLKETGHEWWNTLCKDVRDCHAELLNCWMMCLAIKERQVRNVLEESIRTGYFWRL